LAHLGHWQLHFEQIVWKQPLGGRRNQRHSYVLQLHRSRHLADDDPNDPGDDEPDERIPHVGDLPYREAVHVGLNTARYVQRFLHQKAGDVVAMSLAPVCPAGQHRVRQLTRPQRNLPFDHNKSDHRHADSHSGERAFTVGPRPKHAHQEHPHHSAGHDSRNSQHHLQYLPKLLHHKPHEDAVDPNDGRQHLNRRIGTRLRVLKQPKLSDVVLVHNGRQRIQIGRHRAQSSTENRRDEHPRQAHILGQVLLHKERHEPVGFGHQLRLNRVTVMVVGEHDQPGEAIQRHDDQEAHTEQADRPAGVRERRHRDDSLDTALVQADVLGPHDKTTENGVPKGLPGCQVKGGAAEVKKGLEVSRVKSKVVVT
jgi:hypothetical protein